MCGINFPKNSFGGRADLSIDFFNDKIDVARDESANGVNVPAQGQEPVEVQEHHQEPVEWKPQLDSMLNRAEDHEHGGVRQDELNRLLEQNDIRLSEENRKELDGLQSNMAMSMNKMLSLKKSAIMVDKWLQEENLENLPENMKAVIDAIDSQTKLATKLRDLGNTHPEIKESLNEMAGRCERLATEMSEMYNAVNAPSSRAKEIVHAMGEMPEILQNLKTELDKCQLEEGLKNSIMLKFQNAKSEWSLLGNPRYALKIAREIHDLTSEGNGSNFSKTCNALSGLSKALRDLRAGGASGRVLEGIADAIDRNLSGISDLARELPELLEIDGDMTFQEIGIENTRGQWKSRLDTILKDISVQEYGYVTMDDINQAMEQLGDVEMANVNLAKLQELQSAMKASMDELHSLNGSDIQAAYLQEEMAEFVDLGNQNIVIETIDNAIESQQKLADELRAVGKAHPELRNRFENLADKCDRRTSEILATVNEMLNPPRAEEILRELGRSPEALKNLETELANSHIKSSLKVTVMRKYNEAMEALRELGAQNALVLNEELQNGAPNGQPTHFEKAYDALNDLSEMLHRLRENRHAGKALDDMADAVDRHMVHIVNLGNELPGLLEAHKNETVKNLMVENVPQMHGTQEVIAHFYKEVSPLMQKLDDFSNAQETVRGFGELLHVSNKLTKLKQNLNNLIKDGQITLKDGSLFVPDSSIMEPLKGLVEKAQASLDNYKNFFQKNAKIHQLRMAIRKSVPIDIQEELLKSNFWKTHFPALNRAAEFSVRLHHLGKLAESNPENALDGLKELRLELNEMRADDDWDSRYKAEIERLDKLQKAIKNSINHEEIMDAVGEGLVDELKQNASSEPKTGDMLSVIAVGEFTEFRDGMLKAEVEFVNYKMDRLEHIFQNVQAQNQLCDEYMKGVNLLKAFKENIPLSTIIETRLHNVPVEFVDELCDDTNLVGAPAYLGEGGANTVQKCSYRDKDGKIVDKVFKAEYEGRLGNMGILLGRAGVASFQNAYFNIASRKVAEVLHSGDLMPKASVGMLHGEYGLFMDFVPGCLPENLYREYMDLIQGLSAEEKNNLRGQTMKKSNKLQWNDLLMAQGDRHQRNYGLELKMEDGRCQSNLIAFDNDACLPEWKVGLTKINIKGFHLDNLTDVARFKYIGGKDAFLADLEAKGGVIHEADGSFTLDTSKMNINQLDIMRWTTGIQFFKVPDYMDKDIFDGLMELKNNFAKFDACLPSDLTSAARNAAKARLREMIALAEKYEKDGRVLDTDQWCNPDIQQKVFEENVNAVFNAGGGIGGTSNLLDDIYFRDLSSFLN